MSSSSSTPGSAGPRAKCDQVIFEAIAKAAEIIAFSRSPSLQYGYNNHNNHNSYSNSSGGPMGMASIGHPSVTSSATTLSARFNLQVPEIAEIRQSLQHHRHSLHLPLRLNVYANQVLVERWSLEYLQQQSQPLFGDPIVQLRQVCKKLVIWLRTLYCWTRMLPSFYLRGPSLQYRLEVCEGSGHVPHFAHVTSKEVPTPYGLLLWKVWYSPNVQKPATKPIPIQTQISCPSPISSVTKSAPNREYLASPNNHQNYDQRHPNTHQVGSVDRARSLTKAHSNVEDRSQTLPDARTHTRSHSTISRRAALHDPPTYAYNNTATQMQYTLPITSSPHLFGATPPTAPPFLSSTPPALGFLLPPPMRSNNTPPFSNLPRQLSKPEELCTLRNNCATEPLPSSLDLLHSSPFRNDASAILGDSQWLRSSSVPIAYDDGDMFQDGVPGSSHFLHSNNSTNYFPDQDGNEDDDMPFAVEMDDDFPSNSTNLNNNKDCEDIDNIRATSMNGGTSGLMMMASAVKSSVSKKQPLSILETELSQDLSSLSLQLQEFKAFGTRLDQ